MIYAYDGGFCDHDCGDGDRIFVNDGGASLERMMESGVYDVYPSMRAFSLYFREVLYCESEVSLPTF